MNLLQKRSRTFEAIANARKFLKEHFGVAGSGFLIKAICLELLEISLQSLALFRYAASEDVILAMATCTLLFLNCVLSPIAYAYEKKDAVIVLDCLFDIGYMIINAIRINVQKAPIDAIDALALMLPICSIIDIMANYAQFSIRERKRKSGKWMVEVGRMRQGSLLFRLPHQSVGSSGKEAPTLKKVYRTLQILLAASALPFSGFSGYVLVRCATKHIQCLDKYSSCLWKGAWPREYYINGSIFDSMTCGEEHVESIDAWSCADASGEVGISDIAFESFLRLTDLRLGDVVFPKSLARLMELPGAALSEKLDQAKVRVRNLQEELDMSNFGIKAVPLVFVDMLEEYVGGKVKHVDLSGNGWSEPQARQLLSAISCDRKSSRFCNLASIDLSKNNFEAIPSTLLDKDGAFPSLSNIDVGTNQVRSITATLIRRMVGGDDFRVNLESNPVTTIAAASTDLGSTSFEEFIHWAGTLVNMSGILSFNIAFCGMRGNIVSNALVRMPNLEVLSLYSNPLGGTLPSEVGLLTQLNTLDLANNAIIGSIPSQLGQLTQLTRLGFNINILTGSIPSQISQLIQLQKLSLGHNNFVGNIPSQLCLLTQLQHLSLYSNNLTGSIPSQLGLLTQLQHLSLYDNDLTGSVPSQLGMLTPLRYLDLNNNNLNGSIFFQLFQLTQLQKLDLNNNTLTGSLPLSARPTDPIDFAGSRKLQSHWIHSVSAGPTDPTDFAASQQERSHWINSIPARSTDPTEFAVSLPQRPLL